MVITIMSSPHPLSQKLQYIQKPSDFTFCSISKTKYNQKHDENENHFSFSSPIWPKTGCSNYTCPSSPTTATLEGREELDKIIKNLPESYFELSLKDIVVKDPNNLGLVKEERVDTKPGLKGKKKSRKKSPISRSVSLDSGVFLLRMFIPSSLGLNKHKVSGSSAMDSWMKQPSSLGLNKHDVEWCKTWFFLGNKNTGSSRSCKNRNDCTSATKDRFQTSNLQEVRPNRKRNSWISRAEAYFTIYRTNEASKLALAEVNMEGDRIDWFQSLTKTAQFHDWTSFTKVLLAQFGPSEFESAQRTLFKLCQIIVLLLIIVASFSFI